MNRRLLISVFALLAATTHRATAQVQAGKLNMNLSGNVTGGYTSDFGSNGSDHGFNAGGAATLTGSYYDPNFLSFTILPFLNQSWANSDYQSIVNSSGVTASTGIFNGTNYPGSISYTKTFNSTGNFGVPGVANYTSRGDSDNFNIGWSEHVPNLPILTVGFQQGTSDYSLYGASSDVASNFHGINGTINYMVAGFTLNGGYHYLDNYVNLPVILGTTEEEISKSHSNSYTFGLGHALPFHGTFSASAARSDFSSGYTGGSYSGMLDTISSGVSFNPINGLNMGALAQYNDNLLGSIYQPILAAGGVLPAALPEQSSHSLDVMGYGTYAIPDWHVTFSANDDHRDETLWGTALSSDVFTGTVTYGNDFLGGYLNITAGANHSIVNPSDITRTGFLGSGNYSHRIHSWQIAASGNYIQNAQTLLITTTTNSYGYSGTASRKIGVRKYVAMSGSGTKTSVLGGGSGSYGQSYSASLVLRVVTAAAGYSHSSGNGVLTATGISSISVLLPVVTPSSVILYGGTAYSASIAVTPATGLTLSASYSRAISNTQSDSVTSNNRTEQYYARVQYMIRKVYFQAGYLRLTQGFSDSTGTPVALNSFYVGLMRWFNFF